MGMDNLCTFLLYKWKKNCNIANIKIKTWNLKIIV